MTTNHTPGPWFAQGTVISPTRTGKRFAICEVYRDDVATAKANARLIAAAPELLAALQSVIDSEECTLGDGGSILGDDLRTIAREAIAKAQGA